MKRLVVEYWTPLVLWLALIFFFSTDVFGAGNTFNVIAPILNYFFPSITSSQLETWHIVIRKLGHITEYFILAVFAYRTLREQQPDARHVRLKVFVFVACAAALDEVHQRFTLSRTASPVDVGYDCLGAAWALWLINTYETRRIRSHSVL